MRRVDHGHGQVALAGRRPHGRRGCANAAPGVLAVIDQRIDGWLLAVDFQADQALFQALLLLLQQGAASGEMALVHVHQPFHAQFERRAGTARAQCEFSIDEFRIGQQQASLDARHFQCRETDRADAARLASRHQQVPQRAGMSRFDPEFVTQVAGKAGARHHDFETGLLEGSDFERLEFFDAGEAKLLEHGAGRRALQGEGGNVLGDFAHLHVETDGRIQEPVQLPFGGAEQEFFLAQPEDGAVVDDMAVVVAPHGVGDAIDLELADITRDQSIQESLGIRPADLVLDHRRHVEQGRRVANREVLVLHRRENRQRVVAAPLAEGAGFDQRLVALEERGGQQRLLVHRGVGVDGLHVTGLHEVLVSPHCDPRRPSRHHRDGSRRRTGTGRRPACGTAQRPAPDG